MQDSKRSERRPTGGKGGTDAAGSVRRRRESERTTKPNKVQSIDKIRLFNDLRSADFDSDDINTIIKILTERNFLYSAVPKTSKGSIPIEDFLENFWDYDKSPYIREKPGKKQSQFRSNGHTSTILQK